MEEPESEDEVEEGGDENGDMSGDARTYEQAMAMRPRPYAECSLSAYRNIIRDEFASREDLAARQRYEEEITPDLRFPDWDRILQEQMNQGERVVSFYPQRLTYGAMWMENGWR